MIRLTGLELVAAARPFWFCVQRNSRNAMLGTASVAVPGGAKDFVVTIEVAGVHSAVTAREADRQVLPAFCPERHINADSSFCLGYGIGDNVVSRDDAEAWWNFLKQYLLLQRTASRTRRWPKGHSIAHGAAGRYHVEAIEVAARLGIKDSYDAGVAGELHWATDGRVKALKEGVRLLNGRLRCPMKCDGHRGKPLLRRECCQKGDVARLVYLDRKRREEEARFWQEMRRQGRKCCGTLDDCPLKTDVS